MPTIIELTHQHASSHKEDRCAAFANPLEAECISRWLRDNHISNRLLTQPEFDALPAHND